MSSGAAKPKLFWFLGQPSLITPTLFTAVFASCIGSSLLFGYSMAVLNNLEMTIKCFLMSALCNSTTASKQDQVMGNALYASLTTTYIVLGTVGSFISGIVNDFFGRKKSIMINNIIAILGSVLNLLVYFTKSKANIYIGRLILGFNAGLTTGIAPTFIAEIAPTQIRGALTACHQLSITMGIVLAYFLTMKFTFNNALWVISLGIPLIPAVASLLLLPFCPESPRYLFVNNEDRENVKNAFNKYNQVQEAESLIQEIEKEVEDQKKTDKFKIMDLFMNANYRMAIIISIVLNVMQQFSGINAVIGYSQNMMSSAQVPEQYLELCVLLIGLLNCISTIPAVLLMEVGGRRSLLIFPSCLSIVSLVFCFLMIGVLPAIAPKQSSIFAIISVFAICTYIIGFALGMGPVPGIIVAEMFTQAPRAAAYSLVLGIQWTSSFVILLLYPIINGLIPNGFVFVIFVCFTLPSLLFLMKFMPETKNRSFADVAADLAGKKLKMKQSGEEAKPEEPAHTTETEEAPNPKNDEEAAALPKDV